MENPLFLFPQLNISSSKEKNYCKAMKSTNKEEANKEIQTTVSPEEAVKWGESFDKLLSQKAGLDAFTRFLKTEFSEENIEFWTACEDYKKNKTSHQLIPTAKTIYDTFVRKDAPKEVNLDFHTKEFTAQNIIHPTLNSFDAAQAKVYRLMEQDSYPRFLRSDMYLDLIKGDTLVILLLEGDHALLPSMNSRMCKQTLPFGYREIYPHWILCSKL